MLLNLNSKIINIQYTHTTPVLAVCGDSITEQIKKISAMKQLELDETPHYCGVYPSGHDAKDKDTFTHLGRQNTRFTNTEHLRAIEKLYGLDNPTETGVYFCLFNNADRPFFEHWEEKPIKLASHFGAYIMERVIFMPFNMGLQEDGIQSVFYFGEDITRDDCPIKKAIRLCYRSSL